MSKLCGSEKSYNIFYTVTSWQLTLTQIVCFRQCLPLSKETSQDERCGGKVRSLGNAHLFLYDRLGQNGLSKTTTRCWKAQSCYAKTFTKIIRFSSFMEYNFLVLSVTCMYFSRKAQGIRFVCIYTQAGLLTKPIKLKGFDRPLDSASPSNANGIGRGRKI